jgi:hypothetical protein
LIPDSVRPSAFGGKRLGRRTPASPPLTPKRRLTGTGPLNLTLTVMKKPGVRGRAGSKGRHHMTREGIEAPTRGLSDPSRLVRDVRRCKHGLPARGSRPIIKHKKPGALRQLTYGRLDPNPVGGFGIRVPRRWVMARESDAEVVHRPASSSGRPCERREPYARDRIYSSRSASVG